jgi:hypothetical protein
MLRFRRLFGNTKCNVIGMIHIGALPGDFVITVIVVTYESRKTFLKPLTPWTRLFSKWLNLRPACGAFEWRSLLEYSVALASTIWDTTECIFLNSGLWWLTVTSNFCLDWDWLGLEGSSRGSSKEDRPVLPSGKTPHDLNPVSNYGQNLVMSWRGA